MLKLAGREKRCIFCGSAFTGQKRNFEHIIPKWLVEEADLGKRGMMVRLPGISREVSMSRIGLKVCKSCNEADSELEGHAKVAYLAIKSGQIVTDTHARNLLDWLDKVRVGLWLWLHEQLGEKALVEPKFRINGRVARKDRMMLVRRYPEDKKMRGLGLVGVGDLFLTVPSVFGMLINNISISSASSDFLVVRHIRNARVQQTLGTDNFTGFELTGNATNEPRLALLGGASIFAQCILPNSEFESFKIIAAQASPSVDGWSESAIIRLNDNLQEIEDASHQVPIFTGNVYASRALMDRNVYLMSEYLVQDWQRADTKVLSVDTVSAFRLEGQILLRKIRNARAESDAQYRNATGIQLPR